MVVVNLHLYGLDLAMGGVLLPEHELAIIDEAHQLEDIVSATCGIELTGGRFADLARRVRGVIADDQPPRRRRRRRPPAHRGAAPPPRPAPARAACPTTSPAPSRWRAGGWSPCSAAARNVPERRPGGDAHAGRCGWCSPPARSSRTSAPSSRSTANEVVWVEGTDANPVLRVAPLDVADLLQGAAVGQAHGRAHQRHPPAAAPEPPRGRPRPRSPSSMSGSPFDYEAHALLYCAAHLPDPRHPGYVEALTDELGDLIEAAGGRTLALFTSFRVLDEAAAALQLRLDVPDPHPARPAQGRACSSSSPPTRPPACSPPWASGRASTCPGASLSLVTIDRIPFPRPDEPLLQARRERAGARRLRADRPPPRRHPPRPGRRPPHPLAPTDRGVVAVLDPRLAKAGYRWDMVQRPPADAPHQGPRRGPPRPRGDPRPAATGLGVVASG